MRMSTASSSLLVENQGHVVSLTLNRPKALNALDISMCIDIRDMLLHWRRVGLKDTSTPGALIGNHDSLFHRSLVDHHS
jgi:hypothetical protein